MIKFGKSTLRLGEFRLDYLVIVICLFLLSEFWMHTIYYNMLYFHCGWCCRIPSISQLILSLLLCCWWSWITRVKPLKSIEHVITTQQPRICQLLTESNRCPRAYPFPEALDPAPFRTCTEVLCNLRCREVCHSAREKIDLATFWKNPSLTQIYEFKHNQTNNCTWMWVETIQP